MLLGSDDAGEAHEVSIRISNGRWEAPQSLDGSFLVPDFLSVPEGLFRFGQVVPLELCDACPMTLAPVQPRMLTVVDGSTGETLPSFSTWIEGVDRTSVVERILGAARGQTASLPAEVAPLLPDPARISEWASDVPSPSLVSPTSTLNRVWVRVPGYAWAIWGDDLPGVVKLAREARLTVEVIGGASQPHIAAKVYPVHANARAEPLREVVGEERLSLEGLSPGRYLATLELAGHTALERVLLQQDVVLVQGSDEVITFDPLLARNEVLETRGRVLVSESRVDSSPVQAIHLAPIGGRALLGGDASVHSFRRGSEAGNTVAEWGPLPLRIGTFLLSVAPFHYSEVVSIDGTGKSVDIVLGQVSHRNVLIVDAHDGSLLELRRLGWESWGNAEEMPAQGFHRPGFLSRPPNPVLLELPAGRVRFLVFSPSHGSCEVTTTVGAEQGEVRIEVEPMSQLRVQVFEGDRELPVSQDWLANVVLLDSVGGDGIPFALSYFREAKALPTAKLMIDYEGELEFRGPLDASPKVAIRRRVLAVRGEVRDVRLTVLDTTERVKPAPMQRTAQGDR